MSRAPSSSSSTDSLPSISSSNSLSSLGSEGKDMEDRGTKKHKSEKEDHGQNHEHKEKRFMPMYFDYNATTPILPEVASTMIPFMSEIFGNPSSTHAYGIQTKDAVKKARQQVAAVLGCESDELIFLSGGSESINYAIKGAAFGQRSLLRGDHVITARVEHVSVIESCKFLETYGFSVTYLPVDEYGMVRVSDLVAAIRPTTVLVTIMTANNEVGTVNPIKELVAATKKANPNILFHTDASQAVCKVPCRVDELGVDYLSFAAHKFYAPKGIGGLYIRKGTPPLQKQIHGACHEFNKRAGTENVMFCVGLGKACEIGLRDFDKIVNHLKTMRDRLLEEIKRNISQEAKGIPIERIVRVNGHHTECLPNTLNLSFYRVATVHLIPLIQADVACSVGAACLDRAQVSHVIAEMNVPPEFSFGTVRLSVGIPTTQEEVDSCAHVIAKAVVNLCPLINPEKEAVNPTALLSVKSADCPPEATTIH